MYVQQANIYNFAHTYIKLSCSSLLPPCGNMTENYHQTETHWVAEEYFYSSTFYSIFLHNIISIYNTSFSTILYYISLQNTCLLPIILNVFILHNAHINNSEFKTTSNRRQSQPNHLWFSNKCMNQNLFINSFTLVHFISVTAEGQNRIQIFCRIVFNHRKSEIKKISAWLYDTIATNIHQLRFANVLSIMCHQMALQDRCILTMQHKQSGAFSFIIFTDQCDLNVFYFSL